MVNRIWMENRQLGRRLVEWLQAESDHGHDDYWRRLTLLSARFLGQVEEARNDEEQRLIEIVVQKALDAWRFNVTSKGIWSIQGHEFAYESLAALAPVAGKAVVEPLTAALRAPALARHAALTLDLIAEDTPPTIAFDQVRNTTIEETCAAAAHFYWTHGHKPEEQDRIRSLSDQNRRVRWLAARARGIVSALPTVTELRGLLGGDDEAYREDAIQVLAEIGSNEAVDALVEVIGHGERAVRDAVAQALAFIASDYAVDAIHGFLASKESRASLGLAAEGEELARRLGTLGEGGMADELIAMMRSHGQWLGHAAVEALGDIGSERAVGVLATLVRDTGLDKEIRSAMLEALAAIASPSAVGILIEMLEEDVELRGDAALVLGRTRSRRAIGPLTVTLGDDDRGVRADAADALGDIGAVESVDEIVHALDDAYDTINVPLSVALSLVKLIGREHAADKLIDAVHSLGEDGRVTAARFLAHIGEKETIEYLREHNPLHPELAASTEALWEVVSKRATPALIKALADDNAEVRKAAAVALGKGMSESAADALAGLFEDADFEVRMMAAKALGDIPSDHAADILIKVARTADSLTQMNAIDALGRMRCERAVDDIVGFLQHEVRLLRITAAHALGQIRSGRSGEALIEAMKDKEEGVRQCAAQALGTVKTPEAERALLEALGDDDDDVRVAAIDALAALGCVDAEAPFITSLEDGNPEIRRAAGQGLARIGSDRAVPALMRALEDREWEVRMAATTALWKIPAEAAFDGLTKALRDETEHIRALAAEGIAADGSDRAIEVLLGYVSDEGKLVRLRVAEALAQDRSERTMPALVKLAIDSENEVGDVAYQGLVQRCGDDGVLDALRPVLFDSDSDEQGSAVRLLLKKNGTELCVRAIISAIREERCPASAALDAHCRDRGVTVFTNGRLAKPEEQHLHDELWPNPALGD